MTLHPDNPVLASDKPGDRFKRGLYGTVGHYCVPAA